MDNELSGLIQQLIESGVTLVLSYGKNGNTATFENGFYKSGSTYLDMVDDKVVLHSRYGDEVIVSSLEDVVVESHKWFEYSKSRFEGWGTPPKEWQRLYDLFITN